ncbi:MAG: phage antirepressor KilAC domain-containing protein [Solobacterium sp.]|nr:phage antirepressor KilAC domain-containing protein [Solobacterium sp.]
MELSIFNNQDFGSIRVTSINGDPWFVAVDVCRALEIGNSRMATDRLDDDEKSTVSLTDTSSNGVEQRREMIVVNEPGLYALVLGSRKPEAKAFKRWITHEVVPSIRKYGAYATETTIDNILNDPDFGIRLLSDLKAERQKVAVLKARNEEMRPKEIFADAVSASHTSILIGDLAKLIKQNGYDIGQKRLFQWLRDNDYLIKNGSSKNMPTQKAMDLGLFEVKERTINNPDGSIRVTKTTKVTGKGQVYFINKFIQKE